jgi:hypothetical protein
MKNLTFKQYLESKEQLLKAIHNTPTSIIEYEVRKYCTLPVGEIEIEKEAVTLKPKNTIIVEWQYDDINNPTPINIKFKGLTNIDETDQYSTYWNSAKFQKWLTRHTQQGATSGHLIVN